MGCGGGGLGGGVRVKRLTAVSALLVSVGLAAGACSSDSSTSSAPAPTTVKSSPLAASGIATLDDYLPDIVTSLGLRPLASVSSTATGWLPTFGPYSAGVKNLGEDGSATASLETLAAARPKTIIAPDAYRQTIGKSLSAIAPTIYYNSTSIPATTGSGQIVSDWKLWLYQVASQIGRGAQANEVVANLANQAAAIKGQTGGKTLAYVRLGSASTWNSGNDYLPVSQVYVQDLGLKNFQLPSSDFDAGCGLKDTPPQGCQSSKLSMEVLPTLSSAAAILVQENAFGASDVDTFKSNPLFAGLPAVKDGHLAEGAFFTRLGPLGVAYEYTAVAKALGLKQFHARVSGDTPAKVSLTLDPSGNRLCWAVEPAASSKPNKEISLASGDKKSKITLTKAPQYTQFPASLSSVGIQSPSDVRYQATGCGHAPDALASSLQSSPPTVHLDFGGGKGTVESGADSVIAGS